MTGARGEGYLEVEGERYAVLFTNRALAEAERLLGRPVLAVLSALRENTLGLHEVAQLLAVGLEHARRDARESRRPYTINDAFQVMDQIGFVAVATVVLEAVAAVLTYRAGGEARDDENPPG